MEIRLKRVLSLVLAMVMVIGMMPTNIVFAEENPDATDSEVLVEATAEPTTEPEETTEAVTEPEETTEPATEPEETTEPVTEPEETTEAATEPEEKEPVEVGPVFETITVQSAPDVDLPGHEELFAYFAERELYGYDMATFGETNRANLNAAEQAIYDAMKVKIEDVAASGGSTQVVLSEVSGLKTVWTNTELGVTSIDDTMVVDMEFASQFNFDNIVTALLYDCPFDLYWYDKTVGVKMNYKIGRSGMNNGTQTIWDKATISELTFIFAVSSDYESGTYCVTSDVTRVSAAKNEAAQVVAENADKSDYEKFVAYKTYICDAVTYDHAAADNDDTPYGDPWQLISVFDGNDSTNVVCEGYSKAFQYLCDLDDLDCISVSGMMGGGTGAGNHMWNVVTLEGAKYLVDVTNSDTGSVGQNGGLFLVGGTYQDGGYSFLCGSQTVVFTCSDLGLSADSYTYQSPVMTYKVTVSACENGTVTAAPASAEAGTEIRLTVTPAADYALDTLTVTWGNNQTVEVADNKFTMPAGDVTVTATFKKTGIGGTCGENLTWTLDDAGTLTISGTGAMANYSSDDQAPWYDYRTQIKTAVIGNGVTSVGNHAFENCSSMTSVSIPDGVTGIGYYAFHGCSSLTSVSIPDSVASIDWYAFYGCSSLTSVSIPDSMTSIGFYVFYYCTGLESVHIPDSVTSIESGAFYGCENLTNVNIPTGVTSIGSSAFYGCKNLTSVSIPDSVTSIGGSAFSGCSGLTSVNIPTGVTSIESGTFSECSSLTSISIPDSVTNMEGSVFFGCSSLTSIRIPDGVTSIGNLAFAICSNLTSVSIPDSVTSIGESAFSRCSSLTGIRIPEGVTSIGESAFSGCTSLTSVNIPTGVTSIENSVFWNCARLTSVNIPTGVTSIGYQAFYGCNSLTSVDIPDGVTSIESGAFYGCDNLTSVSIPDSVTSIGYQAFYDCDNLNDLYFSGTAAQSWRWEDNVSNIERIHYSCASAENHWQQITVDPTCREAGYTGEVCKCANPYIRNKVETAAALGHQYGEWYTVSVATCTTEGVERKDCEICNYYVTFVTGPLSHKMGEWVVTEAATCTAKGSERSNCANCDYYETRETEKLDHTYNKEVAEEKYLETAATCTAAAVYYKSCACGEKGTETFAYGERSDHVWDANHKCSACGHIGGTCGENLIWLLDEAGMLTISGTGATESDYSWGGGPWCYYDDQITELVIEDGVTVIGECAFYKLSALKSVKIPSSVTYLHSNAFAYCEALTDIVFMHTAEDEIYVEYNAFRTNADTTNHPATEKVATTVYLPYYPRSINQAIYTYFNATATASRITVWDNYLTVPVTNISLSAEGDVTEKECGEAFTITANLTPIYSTGELKWMLSDPTMGTLEIGNDQAVFTSTKTGMVTVRCASNDDETTYGEIQLNVTNPTGTLTGLDLYVQGYTADEIELDIPTQVFVSYIPENAAERDVIWAVENLDGEATVDENGIVTPTKAGSILVTATSRDYPDICTSRIFKIVRYVDSMTILLNGKRDVAQIGLGEAMAVSVEVYPADASVASKDILLEMGKLTGDAKWSENVIEGSANGTVRLTATAPDSRGHSVSMVLEVIGEESSHPVEGGNIYYNTETGIITRSDNSVTRAVIPSQIGDTTIVGIGANAFVKRNYYLPWSNEFSIETNETLKSVKIPDTVTFIGKNAFRSCAALSYVDMGKGITTIEQYAFYQTGLVTLTIPNSLANIGKYAFCGLNSLTTLIIPGELDTRDWLSYNNTLNKVTFTGNTIIEPGLDQWGYQSQMPGRNAKTVVISDTVTTIENHAFLGCGSIETVLMGSSVSYIGDYVFNNFDYITSIILPDSLAYIGEYAFFDCDALSSLNLPDALTHIGKDAFAGSNNLQIFDLSEVPDTVTQQNFPLTDDLVVVPEILISATNGKANLCWSTDYTDEDEWGEAWVHHYSDGRQELYIEEPGKIKLFCYDEYTGARGSKVITCELGLEIDGLYSSYLTSGEKVRLTARRMPGGEAENVKWSLRPEDKAYATLSATSGKYTDLTVKSVSKATSIQVTATSNVAGEAPETRTIWILPKTVSITVTNQDTGVELGKTGTKAQTVQWDMRDGSMTLKATVAPQDASSQIYWESSNYNVAEVDYEGVILPKQPGTTTITAHATDGSGKTASFKLQVYYVDPAAKLTGKADVPTYGLEVLDSAPIHVYGTDKQIPLDPAVLNYSIPEDQLEIAQIDEETGILTALKPGNVTVTAAIKDDPLAREVKITVKVIPAQTERVFLTTQGSQNSTVVMLDPNGEVTTDPEQAAKYRVYLDKEQMLISESFTVSASATDANGNPMELTDTGMMKWATTDKRIATVTAGPNGSATVKVNAKIDGACVITATSTDLAKVEGVLEIFVRDYTPRLEASSVTMNSYLKKGISVGLKPAYVAQFDEDVEVLEYVKSSKTYEATGRFTATYEDGTLTIKSGDVVNNGTYKLKLRTTCTTETGAWMPHELPLTLKVANKLPAITVKQSEKFNLFYDNRAVSLTVTAKGETVTDAWIDNASTASFYADSFNEETSAMGVRFTDEYVAGTAGKLDTKMNVMVKLAGYRVDAKKAITLSTTTAKPSVSLTPASSIINMKIASEHSIAFRVFNKTDNEYMDISVEDVEASFADVSVDQGLVKLTVREDSVAEKKSVSATVTVQGDHWMSPIELPHKITLQKTLPTVKFSFSALKLNRIFTEQTDFTEVSLSQQNMSIDSMQIEPADTKAATRAQADKIVFEPAGNTITAKLKADDLPKNGTYNFRAVITLEDGVTKVSGKFKVTVGSAVPTVKLTTPTLKLNKYLGKDYAIAQSAFSMSKGDGYELVGFNLPASWSNSDIAVSYEDGLVTAVLRRDNALTGKYGKHTVALTPVLQDLETEQIVALPTPVKLTVQVESKTPSVTVTAKGKLDTNLPNSEIIYTIKRFSNVPGTATDVTLEGDHGSLFEATLNKEQKTVSLKMRPGETYNPKTTYKVTLVFHISGQEVKKAVTFKVAQTSLKLAAIPTLRLYQFQTSPMKAEVKVSAPAGAAIAQISLSNKTSYQFRRALGAGNMKVDLETGVVTFEFEHPGYLTYGKSYTVYLDVTPVSNAVTVKTTQVKLTVKSYK